MNERMNEVIQECVWVYACVLHFYLHLCVPKDRDKEGKRKRKSNRAAVNSA